MAIKKPPIRRPLPPVQPPPREELPPIEEELPPVEPIEPVELYPLISRLYPSFPVLKLEELPTKMVELGSLAQEDPEAFLYDLDFRATPEERDIVLRALGVTEEYFAAREIALETIGEEEARITELVTTVFPDIETPERLIEFATEDWDLFILSIQEKGRSKETQDLLRLMGFEWEDIGEIFATERVLMDVEGVRTLVTIDTSDRGISLVKDMQGRVIGEIDPITKDVIPYQYRIGDTWEHFTAGVGDVIVTAGGALKWLGAEGMGENLSEFGQFLQLQAPPDALGEFEWSHLLNPRFYATRVTRTLPFTLSLIPAMIAGKYAGLAVALRVGVGKFGTFLFEVLGAVALARPLESALEAGGVYDRALEKGLSEAEARKAASETFVNNLALVGLDAIQLAVAFAPMPARVFSNLIVRGLVTTARVGGRLTITGLSEAGEEWYQEIIQRVALGEDVVWDAEMKEVVAIGGIIGIGFGTAGEVWLSIQNKTVDSMPTDARTKFNNDRAGFIEQGFDEKQATIKALDLYAETEEGQAIIRSVIENEKVDALEKEIKPETEADKIVWEQTFEQMREEIAPIPEVVPPVEVPAVPEVEVEAREEIAGLKEWLVTEPASRLTHFVKRVGRMKGELPDITIQQYKDLTGKTTVRENILTPDKKHVRWEYAFDEAATEMGIVENGEALRERIMRAWEAKERIKELELVREEVVIPPAVEVPKPPVEKLPAVTEEIIGLPPPTEPIAQGVASNTQGLNEITAKEEVRPSRKVFIKMGIWRDFYKPMSKAEALINEERLAFTKERREINKLLSKEAERRAMVWDEVNKRGSVIGLTFDEKRAVARIREWADRWAERKNLPQAKRIADYIPHLFEEEMLRQIREENGIDPVLARILDDRFAGKITDPFLKQRLGKEIGLLKDPIACMEAYDNVSLKTIYYAPMLNKINAYISDINIPEGSRRYLMNYARRMTGELSNTDIAINKMIGEFAGAIRKAPVFGEWLHSRLTTGNPAGMAAYNLTSALYGLWLGFKATSAIRNLSQHILILAEVGPVHFANAFRLGFTKEGRALWRDSINRRSRKRAFLPGYDSSFIAGWTQVFIDTSLKMFRGADWTNTHDGFLAGVSEAESILVEANERASPERKWSAERLRQGIVDRGDEVFADTQYLYTKMNSMAFAQNAPGRVLSMLTTWTGNWLEIMAKWIKRTPSQVYLEFEQETGVKVAKAAWATSYKAILLYMMIVGLGFAIKEKTRLKAWEYTGITSVRYLADIIGGDFPALQAPGAVADAIVGFLTGDERRLNEGLYSLRTTFTPSVMRQLDSIAAGDKDWLTFFFYVEGRNIQIKRLKEKWEKDWKDYPIFEDADARRAFILKNKDYAGLTDTAMRKRWREENPLIEAKMFVVGQLKTLLSDESRTEALRLIEKHKLDTELIDGYENVFGIDTRAELNKFQTRIGALEVLVVGEEAKYFTMGNYVSEINALVKSVGRHKVQTEASPLTLAILEAQDTFEAYEVVKEGDARTLWRQQYPEAEAWMYLLGKVSSFKNPKSAEILLGLMRKYNIPPEAISAFIEDPSRYDELFTQKFELEQKWFDQTTEYENFGNTEAPNYIEDKEERRLAREKFKEDNPNWVADMRRIEAIDHDATPEIIDKWAERGREIDKFGASSAEAKLWLLENPETLKWALGQELLSDDLVDEDIDLLRLTADNRELLEEFDAIDAEAREERLAFRAEHPEFDKFLIEVKGYAPHSLRETIRVFRETEDVEDKLELLGDAVYEYGQLAVKDSLTVEEVTKYTWDIRSFDWKRYTLLPHLVHWGNEFYKIFEWLSREPDTEQLKRITERVPDFKKYIDVLLPIYRSEPPDKFPIKTWEALLYLTVNSYRDGAEKLIEVVGEIGFPHQWDKIKEEIQAIPHNKPDDWPEGVDWYEDDWFFIEHPIFYKAMVDTGVMKEKDFSKVPTREIFDKYLEYVKLPKGKRRLDYRYENPKLDAWMVLKFGYTSAAEQKRRAELTPTEEFLEDVTKAEAEFDEAMRELEELLKGLR